MIKQQIAESRASAPVCGVNEEQHDEDRGAVRDRCVGSMRGRPDPVRKRLAPDWTGPKVKLATLAADVPAGFIQSAARTEPEPPTASDPCQV